VQTHRVGEQLLFLGHHEIRECFGDSVLNPEEQCKVIENVSTFKQYLLTGFEDSYL